MRRIRLQQPRSDCFRIDVGRDWAGVGIALVAVLSWVAFFELLPTDGDWWPVAWLAGVLLVPALGVRVSRGLARRSRSLVRAEHGRLLLDGEPLELARVELRVTHRWVTKTPTGYALSLWVMGAVGPEDVPLGHFTSMLDATRVSAQLEDFVAKANVKQAGRTPLS